MNRLVRAMCYQTIPDDHIATVYYCYASTGGIRNEKVGNDDICFSNN